jgi:hypothetical protein
MSSVGQLIEKAKGRLLREAGRRYRQVVRICRKTDMFHIFKHIQETCAPHLQSLPHLQGLFIVNKNAEH